MGGVVGTLGLRTEQQVLSVSVTISTVSEGLLGNVYVEQELID